MSLNILFYSKFYYKFQLTVSFATQVQVMWFPAWGSAFVIIFLSIRIWSVPLFADQITFSVNWDKTEMNWLLINSALNLIGNYILISNISHCCIITIPFFPMFRLSEIICVTAKCCWSNIDANTAQTCHKLVIDFHFPLIKSLSTKLKWLSRRKTRFICLHHRWGHRFWGLFLCWSKR